MVAAVVPVRDRTCEAYLRQHADAKAEGARRIDVTLRGESLDDYDTVRGYVEQLNRRYSRPNRCC